ncbi:hypothetical protein MHF_0890 [Mycoplasma haemofelis Ohio2]|uniref:Uncharacterized protein n=1 Tax=Mycoplasma haemofelis (strain Ohio2) TaxID=859194 RepID=F6FIV0_MYCHI|nr:hypothetical protein MHF_0890 [Mycoplasma haemofelis Ohio2]
MNPNLLKFGLPTIGAAGAGSVGYGVYSHISNKDGTLRDWISEVSLIEDPQSKNWETVFEDLKAEDTELISALSSINSSITKTSKNVDAAPVLREWCNTTLNKKDTVANKADLLLKIKKWCVSQPLTLSEKLQNENKSLLSSGWDTQYGKLKDSIFEDIKDKGENFNSKDDTTKGGQALQKWCQENVEKGTHEEGAAELFKKVRDRCTSSN